HQAVVRAGPDDVHVALPRTDREDRGVHLGTIHVARYRPAGPLERLRIVPCEVAAQRGPGLAAVAAAPETLRRDVQRVRIGLREDDRESPLPPLPDVLG